MPLEEQVQSTEGGKEKGQIQMRHLKNWEDASTQGALPDHKTEQGGAIPDRLTTQYFVAKSVTGL